MTDQTDEQLDVAAEAAPEASQPVDEQDTGGKPESYYIEKLRRENQGLRQRAQEAEAAKAELDAKSRQAEKLAAEQASDWQKVAELAKADAAEQAARLAEMQVRQRDERLSSAIEVEIAGRLQTADKSVRDARARVMRAAIRAEVGEGAFDAAGALDTKAVAKAAALVASVFPADAPPAPKVQGAPRASSSVSSDPAKQAHPRDALKSLILDGIAGMERG